MMEQITKNLYDYEIDRYSLIRSDNWEIRLTRTKKSPWNIFLDIWNPTDPIGAEKLSPGLSLDQIRSIAKSILEQADSIEAEWNALSVEEQTDWYRKMGME